MQLPVLTRLVEDERRRLAHFSVSAVIFFVSCAMIYWIERELPASLDQEISALLAVAIASLSFFWAMLMQVLHIISRLGKK